MSNSSTGPCPATLSPSTWVPSSSQSLNFHIQSPQENFHSRYLSGRVSHTEDNAIGWVTVNDVHWAEAHHGHMALSSALWEARWKSCAGLFDKPPLWVKSDVAVRCPATGSVIGWHYQVHTKACRLLQSDWARACRPSPVRHGAPPLGNFHGFTISVAKTFLDWAADGPSSSQNLFPSRCALRSVGTCFLFPILPLCSS
jgi:hypothetical protein